MNTIQIFRQAGAAGAAAEAGEQLNAILAGSQNRGLLLMLSGGSGLSILEYVSGGGLGANLTVCMLDERWSTDEHINNFAQFQKTEFYEDLLKTDANFFGTLPRNGETAAQLAARWEQNLRAWREANPEGLIVATLGMGPDGHTAGIFPFPEDKKTFAQKFENENWVAAYDAAGKNQYAERITATLTFFKQINIGLAYVCGAGKKEKLQEVLNGQGAPAALPALGWKNIPDLRLFTDLS